jgi:hypothetical protein
LAELAAAEEQSKLNNFVKTEKNIVSTPIRAFKSGVLFLSPPNPHFGFANEELEI